MGGRLKAFMSWSERLTYISVDGRPANDVDDGDWGLAYITGHRRPVQGVHVGGRGQLILLLCWKAGSWRS
jgi:hypothetical protein